MTSHSEVLDDVDVAVIGAGIVGLAHAYHAARRGLSVAVVERDGHAVGASVRNFGHGGVSVQGGDARAYAEAARTHWLSLAKQAGFWISESGTLVVARAADERAVLEQLHSRDPDGVTLLGRESVAERVPVADDVVGGALLPGDIRVDPREAIPAIATLLHEQGVRFHWRTAAHGVQPGELGTSRGSIRARHIVFAVGHDVDRHFPELADAHGVRRCSLRMLRVRTPGDRNVEPAVLSGTSMLRYPAFAACPSLADVRARIARGSPELLDAGLNLMLTQRPDGDLVIGDTHDYATTVDPFRDEKLDRLVLDETARLLGMGSLTVRERWQGRYADAADPFLVDTPMPGVRVVAVTSGIGMTTALGLAPTVLDELL